MEEKDDDDLKVQRATVHSISLIKTKIPRLLESFGEAGRNGHDKSYVHQDAAAVCDLLDVFQEEPELLDPHLKTVLPSLIEGFSLMVALSNSSLASDSAVELQLRSIAEILYALCKVRGEKVISRFLDNQPGHITSVIRALNSHSTVAATNGASSSVSQHGDSEPDGTQGASKFSWKLRYCLLLWAGHLILTPFDLNTISEGVDCFRFRTGDLVLESIPCIAKDIMEIAFSFLESATKEQASAVSMLVKLTLRPDMLKTMTLDSLVDWNLALLSSDDDERPSIYRYIFNLRFLCAALQSADLREVCHKFPSVFETVTRMFGEDASASSLIQQSAVARKLAIKILRRLTTQSLYLSALEDETSRMVSNKMMQQLGVLEESIDFMLKKLEDPDTQVRFAASKAISYIAASLDNDTGEEVVDAIIKSLGEDVRGDGDSKDLSSVNPLRWHGLTLTLSHMLFRRSPSPEQLESILNALYLTLTFEQRSSTGNSLGTNVRDASNFGLWSLARRYKTTELLGAPSSHSQEPSREQEAPSKIQDVANNLISSACMDPSGNVRRGSSAALQELIGRHPDEVKHGITLVQVVDYQAVGLRKRAMIDVAAKAASLDSLYVKILIDSLFGWRGLEAPDTASRNFAALSLAKLTTMLPREISNVCIGRVISSIRSLPAREVERKHGRVKALAEWVLQQESALRNASSSMISSNVGVLSGIDLSNHIFALWNLFDNELEISEKDLNVASTRAGLITESTVVLLSALSSYLATYSLILTKTRLPGVEFAPPIPAVLRVLRVVLRSTDSLTMEAIPGCCATFCLVLPVKERLSLAENWLKELRMLPSDHRRSGTMVALASAWGTLRDSIDEKNIIAQADKLEDSILDGITHIFNDGDFNTKVMAVRCFAIIVDAAADRGIQKQKVETDLLSTLASAINDYTINERGDVGSLVRLEAVEALKHIWSAKLGKITRAAAECYLAVQRLAVERLDKVRLQAAKCLRVVDPRLSPSVETITDVSTFEYFFSSALLMLSNPRQPDTQLQLPHDGIEATLIAFLEGFASSTGGGSESLIATARSALFAILDALPVSSISPPPNAGSRHLPSLDQVLCSLLALLRANQSNDRTLTPALEMTAFLFDAGIPQRLLLESPTSADHPRPQFNFRTLVALVQKSHFKSGALPKLLAAVHIYRHLAGPSPTPPGVRDAARRKLAGMLAHPFPSVRAAVADALWAVVGVEAEDGGDSGDSDVQAAQEGVAGDGGDDSQAKRWAVAELRRRDWGGLPAKEGKAFGEALVRRWGLAS